MKPILGLVLASVFVWLVIVAEVPRAEDQPKPCRECADGRVLPEAPLCPDPLMLVPNPPRVEAGDESDVVSDPRVRIIYLVPTDRQTKSHYVTALQNTARHLQQWYWDQMGTGKSFRLSDPVVEVIATPHTANWYATNPASTQANFVSWFFWNVVNDGFALTGGMYNDPQNIWIFYIDADPACGQYGGSGGSGTAAINANDLRGLTRELTVQICPNEPPDRLPPCRWVGGLGHELGHALGLPHPPACEDNNPNTPCPDKALMYAGYASYPDAYLLPENKTFLQSNRFFATMNRPNVPFTCDYLLPPEINSPAIAVGQQNQSFSYQITATNAPSSFGAMGLPQGVTVNAATGQISGIPLEYGQFSVSLNATNGVGTGTRVLSLTIDPDDCGARALVELQRQLKSNLPFQNNKLTMVLPTLRKLRDEVLMAHPVGRTIVEDYYRHGPAITQMLRNHPALVQQALPLLVEVLPSIEHGLRTRTPFRLSHDQFQNVGQLFETAAREAPEDTRVWLTRVHRWLKQSTRSVDAEVTIDIDRARSMP